MAKACKILICTWLLLVGGCSTQYDEVAPDTELVINVKDHLDQSVEGAVVYLFSDTVSFNQTIATGNPSGFVATDQTVSGTAHFTKLTAEILYSIYVSYKDNSLFPGTYITLDNSEEKYVLKNKLVRGSVSTLTISLIPQDGFVTFWTKSSNSTAFPIDLFLNASPGGSLSQSAASAPGPFQAQGMTVRARKGAIKIEGKSASGCLWTDLVTVTVAQNTEYFFTDCLVGTVAFYTDNTNALKLPVTIKLNANDVMANLTTAVATTPADCSASNLVIASRVPGDYTYEAISPGGNCVWTGSFTLASNSCNLILLSTCN